MEKSVDSGNSNLIKVVVILLLVVVIILAAALAFFLIKGEGGTEAVTNIFKSDDEYTYLLDEFAINLKPEGRTNHYLKLKIALMYKDKKGAEILEPNVNKIRDSVIGILRDKSYSEIIDSNIAVSMKEEIISTLNDALGKVLIQDIYITDILVQ